MQTKIRKAAFPVAGLPSDTAQGSRNKCGVRSLDVLTAIIHEAPVLARGAMFEGPLLLDAHR